MKKVSYMLMLAMVLLSCKSKAKEQENTHPEPIAEPTVADTTRLCDGKKITNTVDLLNYAVGYTTGCQILEQEFKGEVNNKQISALQRGLQQGYTNDTKTTIARQIASELLEQKEKGVMEMFAVNAPIMLQGLVNGLYGQEQMIQNQEAQSYFQRSMQQLYMDSTRTVGAAVMGECPKTPQKVTLGNQTDSLNYIYGQLTGSSMRIRLDITEEDIEPMLVTLNKRLSEKTEDNKMQGIGEQMGMMAKEQWKDGFIGIDGMETRIQMISMGMTDAMMKVTYPFVSMDASGKFIESYLKDIQDKKNEVVKKEQVAYLEQNKQREGVQVTESGLQYEVIKMGKGAKPAATDRVKVHYEGSLIDGSIFDSSYKRGEAITFRLDQVISGWTEGLQLMPVGSKFRLYIPYELGYGERGAGESIPPFATLIFDVELLEINPATK